MTSHRKLIAALAATLSLTIPTAAQSATSPVTPDVFGNGGGDPAPLTATCQRLPVHIPFGRTWLVAKPGVISAMTIVDTELKCVTFHLIRVGKCWQQPIPTVTSRFDHGPAKPGDWSGVDQLQQYLVTVRSCTLAATGVTP